MKQMKTDGLFCANISIRKLIRGEPSEEEQSLCKQQIMSIIFEFNFVNKEKKVVKIMYWASLLYRLIENGKWHFQGKNYV